jgi:glycosyltransferase involved in cell wall biosynthesis
MKRNGFHVVKMDSDGRLYGGNFAPRTRTIIRFISEIMLRVLSLTADLFIIETPEAEQRVLNLHLWLKNKLIMLPNGINQSKLDELSKSIKLDRDKESKKILFVGELGYLKGVDLLIKAFLDLKDKYPDWKLELVGEITPSFKDEIEKLIPRDLKNRITIIGPLFGKDLIEKYMNAEIFCFPSRSESFGLVLIEAMYFNNAIVSSDVGAAQYALDYGKAGMIFKPGDVNELTTKLDELMKDKNTRKKMMVKAKLRCEKLFNWERIIGELNFHLQKLKRSE